MQTGAGGMRKASEGVTNGTRTTTTRTRRVLLFAEYADTRTFGRRVAAAVACPRRDTLFPKSKPMVARAYRCSTALRHEHTSPEWDLEDG